MNTKIKNNYLDRHLIIVYNDIEVKPLRYCRDVPIKVVLSDILKDISPIANLPIQKIKSNQNTD